MRVPESLLLPQKGKKNSLPLRLKMCFFGNAYVTLIKSQNLISIARYDVLNSKIVRPESHPLSSKRYDGWKKETQCGIKVRAK